eukprot:1156017-Pelagomonas_calceolata.AAC.2
MSVFQCACKSKGAHVCAFKGLDLDNQPDSMESALVHAWGHLADVHAVCECLLTCLLECGEGNGDGELMHQWGNQAHVFVREWPKHIIFTSFLEVRTHANGNDCMQIPYLVPCNPSTVKHIRARCSLTSGMPDTLPHTDHTTHMLHTP